MPIKATDLDDVTRRKLKLPRHKTFDFPRRYGERFTLDDIRTNALRALATIAHLTRTQRRRVLNHALKINDV
jgi:hypothetical protein